MLLQFDAIENGTKKRGETMEANPMSHVLYNAITMFHVFYLSNCELENKKTFFKKSGRLPKVVPHKRPKGCSPPGPKQL